MQLKKERAMPDEHLDTATFLKKKETELATQLFPFLLERGEVEVAEQIKVSIRLTKSASTDKLGDSDWEIILSSAYEWDDEQKAYLDRIRDSGNRPVPIPQTSVPAGIFAQRIRATLKRPYFLSLNWHNG